MDQYESDPQSWNLFTYVRNNPLKYTDPSGLSCYYQGGSLIGCDGDGKVRVEGESLIYTPKKGVSPFVYDLNKLQVQEEVGAKACNCKPIPTEGQFMRALFGLWGGSVAIGATGGGAAYAAGFTLGGSSVTTLGLSQTALPISMRLGILWIRLAELPQARNAKEALSQISKALDKIEDAFSNIPKNPNPGLRPDGRMYPPQADFIKEGVDGSITAITRGHIIEIARNGAIKILNKISGKVEFTKPGGGK
jgi:hypothetical protein